MSEQTAGALVVLGALTPLAVFGKAGGVDDVLRKIREEIEGTKRDISTEAGRAQIRSTSYKIARSKTLLDSMGKDLVANLKAQTGAVDAERRRIREELDALQEDFRKPLTDFEDAEKKRVDAHEAAIADIQFLGKDIPEGSAAIGEQLILARDFWHNRDWQEFADRASEARSIVIEDLSVAHEQAIAFEAAEAEADRHRLEEAARWQLARDERLRAEAAEQARREAEEKAAAAARATEELARREREEIEARARREQEAAEAAAKAREHELHLAAVAERDARERAEREKAKAEARARRAEDERLAYERRANEQAAAVAARSEMERIAAAARADQARQQAIDDERRRIEAERKREADEATAREADRKHRGAIHSAARDALVAGGLSEGAATTAITLIAGRKVPGVTISY